jgi:AraC family transcriptional regulator of adaptative response/methylated-DNA-[protein]-cysteine methyltransferase
MMGTNVGTGLSPRRAWAAVLGRDARLDGKLVYAVRTTGVFCRPSCPSRRPDPANVAFFASPGQAKAEGFRACRRCRPEEPLAPGGAAVERARSFIDAHLDETLTLERLAPVAGLSPAHLQRAFKARLGVSPKEYTRARRAERFKAEARRGRSVTDALYEAGYSSGSRLYEDAPRRLGMTPAAYRRGGRGERIQFATAASPVGRVLVAATSRGVCAVLLGDREAELEASLRREFPEAHVEPGGARLAKWLDTVVRSVAGERQLVGIPLDLAGSPFQIQVWNALRAIPYGRTRTYAEVARALGRPSAVRAVARACAANRLALVVPCHRVVRQDGSLGGYRWGAVRKRDLVARESARPRKRR